VLWGCGGPLGHLGPLVCRNALYAYHHSRQIDAFLTTLPGLDMTESFFSLNTTATISQQSQPPLPNWSIPLSKLVTLQALLSGRTLFRRHDQQGQAAKVSVMVCVMAVDTPVRRQRKEEKARGQEGTLWIGGWRVTAPPADGAEIAGGGAVEEVGCVVKLWDSMAREWGEGSVRRGDVVLLESEYAVDCCDHPHLTRFRCRIQSGNRQGPRFNHDLA
jgi:hypothetical protein